MKTESSIQKSVVSSQWSVVCSQACGTPPASSRQGTTDRRPRVTARATGNTPRGFSLIELLVVIGVIVLLASLSFPVMNSVQRAQTLHRARGELTQIETAIELYKTKLGFYPPDNPRNPPNWTINQLYYELLGTTPATVGGQPGYRTLDGSARFVSQCLRGSFGSGTGVAGFMNCAKPGAGDDAPNAVKFLTGLRPGQFLEVTTPVASTVLGSAVGGVPVFRGPTGEITPYGYNCSSPKHNPKSFDLWIDIIAGGKTNRISNWSEKAIIVYWTSPANAYS